MKRSILTVVFIIISLALTVVVLMQEGKSAGLTGTMAGSGGDTYWSKNKGRSAEGAIVKATRVLGALYFIIAAILTLY